MRAKDVMTTSVVTVRPDTTIEEVAQVLLERRISAVPVLDDSGTVIGIVSEGDLMRRAELGTERHSSWWLSMIGGPAKKAAAYIESHGRLAGDVMTSDVIVVDENSSLEEIAELLEERRIKRVPVTRDGHLIGIVSRANLLQGLVTAKIAKATSANDETIRLEIRYVLEEEAGVPDKFINITVLDGVVHMWGFVGSPTEKKAARIAAEGVSGVREAHDHLRIVPLMTPLDLGVE